MYLNLTTWVAKFISMDLLVPSHFIRDFFTKLQVMGNNRRFPQISHPVKKMSFLENRIVKQCQAGERDNDEIGSSRKRGNLG